MSKYYLKQYGRILHHNTDQVEVVGGQADPKFKGGNVLDPTYILLSGRATASVGNERIPVKSLAIKSAKDYLREHFPDLDIDSDVMIDSKSVSLSKIVSGLSAIDGLYFITVGLWVLIFTPITVVFIGWLSFFDDKNYLYVGMASIVLFNLFFAMLVVPRFLV